MSDLDDIKDILEKSSKLNKEKEEKETIQEKNFPAEEDTTKKEDEIEKIDMTGTSENEVINITDTVPETIEEADKAVQEIYPAKEEVQTPARRGRKPKVKEEGTLVNDAGPVKEVLIDGYYVGGVKFNIQKLYPDVIIPEYKHLGDACMDLRAYRIISIKNDMGIEMPVPSNDFESIVIHKDWLVKIGLGFRCELQRGFEAEVSIRSGISSDEGIILVNGPGQIDCPYTGEWCITISKLNKKPFVLKKNIRIAQFKPTPQIKVIWNGVDDIDRKEDNERGDGGFGHSGMD